MMLYKFLSRIDRNVFEPMVVSLTDFGTLTSEFKGINLPVNALGMPRGIPDPRGIYRLSRLLFTWKPQLVQTWMYHADLLGGIASKLFGRIPIVWNIRNSNLVPGVSKRTTYWTAKLCACLSHIVPEKIVCCSGVAQKLHENLGYSSSKMVLIPNGFDLSMFKPASEARRYLLEELNIPSDSILIGYVARYDPQKDHGTFIQAASLLKKKFNEARFVLCGEGISWENQELALAIRRASLFDDVYLLGLRKDIPRITAAFDVASSSSRYGEAFSNAIGEAMACGVPCVVTDVGDSAFIVSDTGKVVAPQDSDALAKAWGEMFEMGMEGRKALGQKARERIGKNFSLDTVVSRYENLYRTILKA